MNLARLPLVLITCIALMGWQARAADDQIGQIKVASGNSVLIKRGEERLPAVPGTPLFESDVIITGDGSAVGMTFIDNSRLSIGPNSELELKIYAFDRPGADDEFVAKLNDGSLSATSGDMVKRKPLSMRVEMPTATLGVRGTEFAVRVKRAEG